MTKPIARDPMYRQRAFDAEVIQLCVRWYITYRLSYRDPVEMMAERGVKVAHSTILRWVTRDPARHSLIDVRNEFRMEAFADAVLTDQSPKNRAILDTGTV